MKILLNVIQSIGIVTFLFIMPLMSYTQCSQTIRLTDTWGDGWNGGSITVSVNGIADPALTNITMATLTAGPEDFLVLAANGDVITITETAAGNWPGEMRVEVLDGSFATAIVNHNPIVDPGTDGNAVCPPCTPSGTCNPLSQANTDHITNVKINTIDNASGCSAYSDYTASSTNINEGSGYLLTVQIGGGLGYGVYTDCAGWVDWNNDGDFIDANETLSFFNNGSPGPMTAFVSVPLGTVLGNKKMRVRSAQGGTTMTPCNITANGEVEDYTLNVNSTIAPSITASILQGVDGFVCLGSFLTLNAIPISAASVTSYQWYYGSFADADIDANIEATQNGVYSIIIENLLGEAAMASFTLTASEPPSGGVIGNYTWCSVNDSVDVSLSLAGNGPFSIVVQPGGLLYNNVNNGDQVSVPAYNPAPNNTTYLTQITDVNGCIVTLGTPVNEIINGDGSSLADWTITDNGGDGWVANGAFRTSYAWDRKFQVIDLLAANYTTAELDTAPIIYASEQYSSTFNNGDEYEYTVTLQDASFNTIESRSIILANVGSNEWQVAALTFENYGAGIRYIRYEHGGVDTEFWLGNYGTRIDNSTINLNVKGNISSGVFAENCPLPVALISFDANCSEENTLLTWTTASETNNDYFTVEKSSNGIDFKEIGRITGNGNSNSIIDYYWTDSSPKVGAVYYRLKQTDFDGKFEYHNTITTACFKKSKIVISPNPFKTDFMVTLPEEWDLPIHVQVIDYLGRSVKSMRVAQETPFMNISLTESLTMGTYFIKISNEDHQFIERIIKMK